MGGMYPARHAWQALRAEWIALLGGAVYLAQAWIYARIQTPTLDEGLYLYKGLLFVEGVYRPFEPYGLWTNKMPLAFLIPGAVEAVFRGGLLSGRIYAILLGLLTLLAVWIATRRLAGGWWAAAVVAGFALNPALVKIYSVAISQVLAACMTAWILALVLGKGRRPWQIVLAGILAGALIMTRINLAPVLILVAGYAAWQHGWKPALGFTLAGAAVVIAWHALYWPDILQVWAPWFPAALTPFLDAWRIPGGAMPTYQQPVSWYSRIFGFFEGIRLNLLPVLAAAVSGLLWPARRAWKDAEQFRAAVLLAALFAVLGLMHMLAALGEGYCLNCFGTYLPFFSFIGLMLAAVTASAWRRQISPARAALGVVLILVVCGGLGFALREEVGDTLFTAYGKPLLAMLVPRVGQMRFLPGKVPLWTIVANKTGLDYPAQAGILYDGLPIAAGVLAGLGVLLVARLVHLRLRARSTAAQRPTFGYLALAAWLVAGVALSPTAWVGGGVRPHDCGGNVPADYARAGAYLAQVIPPGARVYLGDGASPALLLYLPDVKIYPPQLNSSFSLYAGGDEDTLLRLSRWNVALQQRWALEADVDLVSDRGYNAWWERTLSAGQFEEVNPSPPVAACLPRSNIHIYINKGRP